MPRKVVPLSSLASWFRIRREELAIKMLREHSKKVFNCVTELVHLVNLIMDGGDSDEISMSIKRINEMEHEADIMRRNILEELCKGKLEPSEREDLVHLTKRMDAVANNANAAARRISILDYKHVKILGGSFVKMVGDAEKCVRKLLETMEALRRGKEVSGLVDEVNQLEYEVDQDNLALRKELQSKTCENIGPFTAITLSNLIEFVEGIADSAEETAEFIRLVSIKRIQTKR